MNFLTIKCLILFNINIQIILTNNQCSMKDFNRKYRISYEKKNVGVFVQLTELLITTQLIVQESFYLILSVTCRYTYRKCTIILNKNMFAVFHKI